MYIYINIILLLNKIQMVSVHYLKYINKLIILNIILKNNIFQVLRLQNIKQKIIIINNYFNSYIINNK